jgi:hypothetical protein
MTTIDLTLLLKAADYHESAATLALARADELKAMQEASDAQKRRADSHSRFAEVIRRSHRALQARDRKRLPANAPTLEQAIEYGKEIGMSGSDATEWYDAMLARGFLIGKSHIPMKDWKAGLRNGKRMLRKFSSESKKVEARDPEQWRDFLKSVGQPYREYRYATNYLQSDFNSYLKGERKLL